MPAPGGSGENEAFAHDAGNPSREAAPHHALKRFLPVVDMAEMKQKPSRGSRKRLRNSEMVVAGEAAIFPMSAVWRAQAEDERDKRYEK